MNIRLIPYICLLLSIPLDYVQAASTPWQSADHIKVRLVSDIQSLAPDTTFYVGLELQPDEHWHVYWQNPGDSGMPISINWTLPDNISAEKIIWPIPEKIPFGDLTNYGYEGGVIVPVRMRSSGEIKNALAVKALTLEAKANWLVCKDACIPGSANFSLAISAGNEVKPSEHAKRVHRFVDQEAEALELMSGQIQEQDSKLTVQLFANKPVFNSANKIQFFPINEALFQAGANTEIHWKNNFLTLSQEKSESFYKLPATIRGLLVVDGEQAWEFSFNTHP